MRRIFLITITLLFAFRGYSQVKSFSQDPAVYINELEEFFKVNKTDELMKIYDAYKELWVNNGFTDEQKKVIIKTCNLMMQKKMKASPDFDSYISTLTTFSKQKLSPQYFVTWHGIVDQVIKGNKKDFNEFISFSSPLFLDQTIYTSNTKTWKCSSDKYEMLYDKEPFLKFSSTDLTCIANGNTSTIYSTSGVYYPFRNLWNGQSGKVNWSRVGLDSAKVYCTLKKYTVNTDKYEYSIDSVQYTNKMYLINNMPGSFNEKLLPIKENNADNYPKYVSFSDNVNIEDFGKGVKYNGGFGMYGARIIGLGSAQKRAAFSFFYKDTARCKVEAKEFFITSEKITTDRASFKILIAKDSIYHAQLRFNFNRKDRKISAFRGIEGVSSSPFTDSYHKMELTFDEIHWPIDNPIVDMKMTSKDASASFESLNYFKDQRYESFQGALDYNPLTKVRQFCLGRRSGKFYLNELADYMGLKEDYILPFILLMANKGMCYYDAETKYVEIKNKVFDYVNAHMGTADYDILRMESVIGARPNAQMNFVNYDLTVQGVPKMILSDSQNVYIVPNDQLVNIKKNRGMEFAGKVHAGRFDFYGQGFAFDYDGFKIALSNVDSLKFSFPAKEKDDYGREQLVRVNTVLQNIYGTLFIDQPSNKSSRVNYPEYPIFKSEKGSNVFYDYPTTQNGSYDKERFFFKVDPFTIDSLDNFTQEGLVFDGNFVSGGIVPDFRHQLTLQADYSLGFITPTPSGGYPLYQGKGRGEFMMSLNNDGFFGNGKIDYLTTKLYSPKFILLLDSMNSICDSVRTYKSELFPASSINKPYVHWEPYKDSMYIYMQREPFDMYDGQAKFAGNQIITPSGMGGAGTASFNDAEISSRNFAFAKNTFRANVSTFKIKSVDPDKFAFNAVNVKAFVDFEKRIADFKANQPGTRMEFPYNQYKCSLGEFTWKIDEKKILLNKPKETPEKNSIFISTNPTQDSLQFVSTQAVFDLATYILYANKVPFIAVADARVYPDSNKVVIEKNAYMRTLYKAKIKADTITNFHEIYNATVNIAGRRSLGGDGYYDYVDRFKNKQTVFMKYMGVNKDFNFIAKGDILDSASFRLSPHFDFKGTAILTSKFKNIEFDGYVLALHEAEPPKSLWFRHTDRLNQDSLVFKIDDPINEEKVPLSVGFNLSNDSTHMYASFFSKRRNYADEMVMYTTRGVMVYDENTAEFKVGDPDRMKRKTYQGTTITFNEATNTMVGEGRINFNVNTEKFKARSAGVVTHKLADSSFVMDAILLLDFPLPKDAMKIFADSVFNQSANAPDTRNDRYALKVGLAELVDDKNVDEVVKKLEKEKKIKMVDELEKTLLFTELKFNWKTSKKSFIALGPIGVGSVGKKAINKRLFGKVQVQKRRGADEITVYFESANDNWYYFSYQGKTMTVLSSDDAFNKEIKDGMEKVSDSDYKIILGSARDKSLFLKNLDY